MSLKPEQEKDRNPSVKNVCVRGKFHCGCKAMKTSCFFHPRGTKKAIETGHLLMPEFSTEGLIVCVTIDAINASVLMVAWMNDEALAKTIETGQAHYWSRSRKQLWHKGKKSGATQSVVDMRVDCDQDAILLMVRTNDIGSACHTGHSTCFFRSVRLNDLSSGKTHLVLV